MDGQYNPFYTILPILKIPQYLLIPAHHPIFSHIHFVLIVDVGELASAGREVHFGYMNVSRPPNDWK